jgi:hypothetical protein
MRPMLAIDSSDSEIDAATPLKVNSPARTRIRERATQMRQAVHRFEPTTPGDLGLEVGDLVVVTEGDDSKAWWRGYLQGDPGEVVGDFPFNYTEDVDDLVGAHMELDAVNFEMRAHVERRAEHLLTRIRKRLMVQAFSTWTLQIDLGLPAPAAPSPSNTHREVDATSRASKAEIGALVQVC